MGDVTATVWGLRKWGKRGSARAKGTLLRKPAAQIRSVPRNHFICVADSDLKRAVCKRMQRGVEAAPERRTNEQLSDSPAALSLAGRCLGRIRGCPPAAGGNTGLFFLELRFWKEGFGECFIRILLSSGSKLFCFHFYFLSFTVKLLDPYSSIDGDMKLDLFVVRGSCSVLIIKHQNITCHTCAWSSSEHFWGV